MASRELAMFLFQIQSKWKSNFSLKSNFILGLVVIIYCLLSVDYVEAKDNCIHGSSLNESCVCDEGWVGDRCQYCFGRVRYNASSGYITEGPGNYSVDSKCTWLIDSEAPNSTINLWLENFATECSWDHLYVYDGDSIFSPLVAVFSGMLQPQKSKMGDITTKSGYAYLHFFSDAAYNMSGFNISYQLSFCRKNCSGNGVCIGTSCDCDSYWTGDACNIPVCPKNCSSHGNCDISLKKCVCDDKFRGIDCSIHEKNGVWNPVVVKDFVPMGRASHGAVVHNDHMWVISGSDFGNAGFQNVVRYTFRDAKWENIQPRSSIKPKQRYGHSTVVYNNKIFMYGGLVGSNDIVSELWSCNLDSDTWELHSSGSQYAMAVVGHTAHVVDNFMYIFFGHSPVFGYINNVQEYNFANQTWINVTTTGAIIKGGYGHSSVYDKDSKKIFVHGGYHSSSNTLYYLSDSLYEYDPKARHWKILQSSGFARYLHSASIISGMMLVYGGNTHNDSSVSQGAKCYSTQFLGYDLKCDKWHVLDSPNLPWDISRFGHSTAVFDGTFYMFGGFSGVMLNDMYEYTPGNCAMYESRAECLSATPGIRCVWEDTNGCLHPDEAEQRFEQKTIGPYVTHECSNNGDRSQQCKQFSSYCPSCVENSYNCKWCEGQCIQGDCRAHPITNTSKCDARDSSDCGTRHNCQYCGENPGCKWVLANKGGKLCTSIHTSELPEEPCHLDCHTFDSCEHCTSKNCMWCANEHRCVESNSYVASYPYGQCMEWTTQNSKCPATRCSGLRTCSECRENPSCGWCDDGSDTGLGKCIEGSSKGPIIIENDKPVLSHETCPAPNWYFTDCPVCQCNGHSACYKDSSTCIRCSGLTEGDQCEWCIEGHFGNATAGGNCTACSCFGQTEMCDRETGSCENYCHARGVKGSRCDLCDTANRYLGNPRDGGTCYYNLTIDYKFTFNLSKKSDKYYTQISFMNTPSAPDKDVEFMINCSVHALVNITVRTISDGETPIASEVLCQHYTSRFAHSKYAFADPSENTTFLVYVYDFETPIWLEISFSQQVYIDLINFFIWFFSCFLSLLLVAAIVWKIKLRYMLYQRRRRLLMQMQNMASRPFSTSIIEITRPEAEMQLIASAQTNKESDVTRRRRKHSKPSPVALETCAGSKAGVLTLLVCLPRGDEDYTPPGQCGMALGSTLVSIGSHQRKPSTDRNKIDSRHRTNVKQTNSNEGPTRV